MFKVGDKVICISNTERGLIRGNEYIVSEVLFPYIKVIMDNGLNFTYHMTNFDIVKHELESLVQKVNDGREAFDELLKNYSTKVEVVFQSDGNDSQRVEDIKRYESNLGTIIRIKSQKRIFKFMHWCAEIEGDKVIIGCREFDKSKLKFVLNLILAENASHSDLFELYATRKGIIYKYQYLITWREAEELLKELQK